MRDSREPTVGRGAHTNIPNRFEEIEFNPTYEHLENIDEEFIPIAPKTRFYKDSSRTIVAQNDSPDVGFSHSINPYRGCEHGCAYCYARPTHEYLGMSAGLDFETKIFVKEEAPKLLEEKLLSPRWEPTPIFFSGVTDCYQPAERHFRLTRRCLEVLCRFKNPAVLISKNALIGRDVDLFQEFTKFEGILVLLSVTTLDAELCGKMEPRTSRPEARLKTIEKLAKAGVPVGVNVAPIVPGLTDHELPLILKAAADAGAFCAGYTPVRLPGAVQSVFTQWLEQHFPERKEKILSHQRSIKGGKLNDSRFGHRMRGEGAFAENIKQMFHVCCKRYGLNKKSFELNTGAFQRPSGPQLSLF